MDKELINKFILEIADDYEKYGQGRDTKDWLIEAVKRHIIGVDDTKAVEIADEILEGIKIYRDTSTKYTTGDPLEGIKEKLSPEDRQFIEQETKMMAEVAVQDIENALKEVSQDGK